MSKLTFYIEHSSWTSAINGFLSNEIDHAVAYDTDGYRILIAHGYESGLLSVDDETLDRIAPDMVICCYPARVAATYDRMFPDIIFVGAADGWDTRVWAELISPKTPIIPHELTVEPRI